MLTVGMGGLPGVGKSTLSQKLKQWSEDNNLKATLISPDDIRERLCAKEIDCTPELAWNICLKEQKKASQVKTDLIIFDAPHLIPMHKPRPVEVSDDFGYDNVLIMNYSNIKRCMQQQKNRGRVIPKDSWDCYVYHFKHARNLGWKDPWKEICFVENQNQQTAFLEIKQIVSERINQKHDVLIQ